MKHPDYRQFEDYLMNKQSLDEDTVFQQHLYECGECRQKVTRIRLMLDEMKGPKSKPRGRSIKLLIGGMAAVAAVLIAVIVLVRAPKGTGPSHPLVAVTGSDSTKVDAVGPAKDSIVNMQSPGNTNHVNPVREESRPPVEKHDLQIESRESLAAHDDASQDSAPYIEVLYPDTRKVYLEVGYNKKAEIEFKWRSSPGITMLIIYEIDEYGEISEIAIPDNVPESNGKVVGYTMEMAKYVRGDERIVHWTIMVGNAGLSEKGAIVLH